MCLYILGGCKYVADGDVMKDTDMLHDSQSLYSQRAVQQLYWDEVSQHRAYSASQLNFQKIKLEE